MTADKCSGDRVLVHDPEDAKGHGLGAGGRVAGQAENMPPHSGQQHTSRDQKRCPSVGNSESGKAVSGKAEAQGQEVSGPGEGRIGLRRQHADGADNWSA